MTLNQGVLDTNVSILYFFLFNYIFYTLLFSVATHANFLDNMVYSAYQIHRFR